MGTNKKDRQSNIELLRILAMLGVFVQHYANPIMGGGLKYSNGINYYMLQILRTFSICAVDLFIMITGYFLYLSNKRNVWKIIELMVQVMGFSLGVYLLTCLFGEGHLSLTGVIRSMIPANYFVILYCVVYLISPYINLLMNEIKNVRKFVILLFILFSFYPSCVDLFFDIIGKEITGLSTISAYGSQWGYNIVNFILMYIIGAYIRINIDVLKSVKIWKYFIGLFICQVCIFGWIMLDKQLGLDLSVYISSLSYCNPFIIGEAVFYLMIFNRFDFKNRIINMLSGGTFTFFLLHGSFIKKIKIDYFVTNNPAIMLLHILLCFILIYLLCWGVYFIYDKILRMLFRKLRMLIHIPVFDIDS